MELRRINFSDWKILLYWRNDELTRENSIVHDIISEHAHKNWLKDILNDPNKEFYILENESIPVGTIRSDKVNNEYVLSWTIAPEHRNQGYGNKILNIFLQNKKGKYLAKIMSTNIASIKMAEQNGFKLDSSDLIDNEYILLTYYKQI